MTDARYPERWLNDRRILRLSDHAYRSFVTSLAWSVSNRTEGVIEPDDLKLMPSGFDPGDVSELHSAELWNDLSIGWLIDGFEITQTTRKQLESGDKQRAGAAERKRAQRERDQLERALAKAAEIAAGQRHVTGDVTGDKSQGTDPVTSQARPGQARPVLAVDVTEEQKSPPPPLKAAVVSKSGTSPRARGTSLPENWEPSERLKESLRAEHPELKLGLVLEEFRDYWLAIPGQRGHKLDWDRTFRNRVREVAHLPRFHRSAINGHPVGRATEKAMGWEALKTPMESPRKELT